MLFVNVNELSRSSEQSLSPWAQCAFSPHSPFLSSSFPLLEDLLYTVSCCSQYWYMEVRNPCIDLFLMDMQCGYTVLSYQSTDVFVRVRYVSWHIYSCCDATGCGKDTEHLANVVRSVSGEVCLYCLFQSMNTLRFPRWWSPLGTSRQINSAKSSKRENQMNTLDKNPGPN